MSEKIRHTGTIERIDGDCVQVRILQTSACSSCKVAGYCNASESKEKLIDVTCPDASPYAVGQQVTVSTDAATGFQAVGLGFGVPLVVLVAVIVAVTLATGNEAVAALAGLTSLLPYYVLLYLFRNRIKEKISFKIEN